MDWSSFNLHGDAPQRAFESLTGIIFERWCHREYPSQVRQVIFVNGAGGDGGVEAYAQLNNGDIIGLQAKWFREPLESSQISQIKGSLSTAATQRSGLVRYVVVVPRDLSDVRRIGKNGQRVDTERDRWNKFITSAETNHPGITVDLWDETRIASLLAELGSEGLRRYWFERSVTDLKYIDMKFNQAQDGWLSNRYTPDLHQSGQLSNRYTPDLHQSGQIEQDLKIRLNGPGIYPGWLEGVRQMRNLLEDAHIATNRLRRYPEFMEQVDAEILIQVAQSWLIEAIAEQVKLENCLCPGHSFPVTDFGTECDPSAAVGLHNLINVLLPEEKKGSRENAVEPIGKQLQKLLERWYEREITPRKLQDWGQPVIYIGDPGVGKTHALAEAVRQHLAQKKPAVLIRARDVELAQSWESILANVIGQPGWNLRQVLDALESAAIQSEVRSVANAVDISECLPVRVLIAVDGLDETTRAERWAEKLGELAVVAQQYPRILFAFSVRSSLVQRISLPRNIDWIWLRGSDAPLASVFKAHCQINGIQCPPLLRWALRTPLAIRLFAELYRGQIIDNISEQNFSLVELIKRKINNAELSIREREGEDWPREIKPVSASLRAIAKASFATGAALLEEEAMQVVESAQSPKGILTRPQLLQILHQCRDQGLLLLRSLPADDPFEPEVHTWEPAYETLTDFLLAWEAYQNVKESPNSPEMPTYLVGRSASITLAVYLLGREGYNFFTSELWKNNLTGQSREDVQLMALSMMPSQQVEAYQDWVLKLFSQNMPTCRRVLEILIIPGLRIPGYMYSAKFVHHALLTMGVVERDLFWSGPHLVPCNHGAKWEGYASTVLEEFELAEDDPWDSAPLLLAWATTTVNKDNRRRIRSALAAWGHNKPIELLALLETACQTNDPQMKEDLLVAAYGASCLIRPNETWIPLCEWIINSFFTPSAPYRTHNLIIRHCAHSLIDRCLACGVLISAELLIHLRKPYVDANELLPVDRDCFSSINEHHGIDPVTRDLAWYVVPKAIEPFFENSHFARMAHSRYTDVDEDSNDEDEQVDDSFLEINIQVTLLDEDSEFSEQQEESVSSVCFSPSAKACLKRHASAYGLPELTQRYLAFAFAFVRAYALNLGWSEDVFIGNPQGGKCGEILGADIAILRQYSQATHGDQSSMATFGEKYVWAATHDLTGFLADRVTAYDWNKKAYEPPVNLGLLAEVNNPATDIGYGQLNSDAILDFSELVPNVDLTEPLQIRACPKC